MVMTVVLAYDAYIRGKVGRQTVSCVERPGELNVCPNIVMKGGETVFKATPFSLSLSLSLSFKYKKL